MRNRWGWSAAGALLALVIGVALLTAGQDRLRSGDDRNAPMNASTLAGRDGGTVRQRHMDTRDAGSMWGLMGGPMWGASSTASEYDYLAHMVAHHREAITAAGELTRSDRPAMRKLGASIVASQRAQVDQMTTWLSSWYRGRPTASSDYVPQMRDLGDLVGDDLDQAFLADMVPHHMMAIMMSQQLLATGEVRPAVAALARTITSEQHREVVLMMQWSRTWFGQGSPGGMPHPMFRFMGP